MTAKLARNQNQLWTFSDAPPVANQYPEVPNGSYIIRNVFTADTINFVTNGGYTSMNKSSSSYVSVTCVINMAQTIRADRKRFFSKWHLFYTNSSAEFSLSYYSQSWYSNISTSGFVAYSGYALNSATICLLERVYDMDGTLCY